MTGTRGYWADSSIPSLEKTKQTITVHNLTKYLNSYRSHMEHGDVIKVGTQ